MTQGTGLPAGNGDRAAIVPMAAAALVLCAIAAIVMTASALGIVTIACSPALAASDPPPSADDPILGKSLEGIASAFRTEKPDPIASLVPSDGKAYVLLTSVGGSAGYYSRDQVYFIFNKVFAQHDTTKFSIRKQKKEDQGKDFVYCVGDWSYHRHDGVDGNSQIHFVLSMRKGTWALVEIREAQ